MYAKVIIDIPSDQVDQLFTYSIPDGMSLSPGFRVRVPFGRQTKEGYVISLSEDCDIPAAKLKSISEVLENYPAILPHLIELARYISSTMRCPMCEALRLMLPPVMRGDKIKEKTETMVRLTFPAAQMDVKLEQIGKRAVKKRTVLRILSDGQPHSMEQIGSLVKDPKPCIKELAEAGLIETFEQEKLRSPGFNPVQTVPDFPLKPGQQEVLDELLSALNEVNHVPSLERHRAKTDSAFSFLLHGVTGSGKTEVYIQLVRACLEKGRKAIVLVPEIALSPQMVDWFRSRFGDCAAVLHSRLTPGERFDEWRRIRRGDAKVVIGARSAVFAPVDHLGVIIIDEEHESGYQSESFPQYDARQVAAFRAKNEQALLLLASATPSIYSYALARRGDYTLLQLPDRVNAQPLPHVSIVDMRKELTLGNRSIFSAELQNKLTECLNNGHQAILFLNRRGYAPSVSCRACGESIHCAHCDVTMTYHQTDQRLHCHYCGATLPVPSRCPVCGSDSIRTIGIGTQRVEEEVHKLFPQVKTIRMDMDTTKTKNAHYELISAFRARQAQVLIGTQMIAKGLDFPQVTLVGAILADLSLNLPDYRSGERTFQLLVQVAGRAGRAGLAGEVVIQTYKPQDCAICAAARQDYKAFFEEEFSRRRARLYPPFTAMARFLCESDSGEKAMNAAVEMEKMVRAYLDAHPQDQKRMLFLRTDEAPIAFIQGRYRAQVLMKVIDNEAGREMLASFRAFPRALADGTVCFEVNPSSLA